MSSFYVLIFLGAASVAQSVRRSLLANFAGQDQERDTTAIMEALNLSASVVSRRAIYVHWGSTSCPEGSTKLYDGPMAGAYFNHRGSGHNWLCMHPNPQKPVGWSSANNDGALLYGVEYQGHGNQISSASHVRQDAACAVCQWEHGASVYVEWGKGNPGSSKAKCDKSGHQMLYTGMVMAGHYSHQKSEFICVDSQRESIRESKSGGENSGYLYPTEVEQGSSDQHGYAHDVEVGCTVCGIPSVKLDDKGRPKINPTAERSVFTWWGSKTCPNSEMIYTGWAGGSHYTHRGSGANTLCLTEKGVAPGGASKLNENGALIYGTEYQNTGGGFDKNHDQDAACAVCEFPQAGRQVYTQWGRSTSCSNGHHKVYSGMVMAAHFTQHKNTFSCVDDRHEFHGRSSSANQDGNLWYLTEMERGSAQETHGYQHDVEVGCSVCAGAPGKSVFPRWGSTSCPSRSTLLYPGWMGAAHYNHRGSGANVLCMHQEGEKKPGVHPGNQNGALIYGMEYQNNKNHNQDAACAMCELDRFEEVYTQWGRSDSCSNGHQTLYCGHIMANHYTQHRNEFMCVDNERGFHSKSSTANHDGGLLYTTETERGSIDEKLYPHDVEVGCCVCAAEQAEEQGPQLEDWSVDEVAEWLKGLKLIANYSQRVRSAGMDGTALKQLALIVKEASVADGKDGSARALLVVKDAFDIVYLAGDALKIMAHLPELV